MIFVHFVRAGKFTLHKQNAELHCKRSLVETILQWKVVRLDIDFAWSNVNIKTISKKVENAKSIWFLNMILIVIVVLLLFAYIFNF